MNAWQEGDQRLYVDCFSNGRILARLVSVEASLHNFAFNYSGITVPNLCAHLDKGMGLTCQQRPLQDGLVMSREDVVPTLQQERLLPLHRLTDADFASVGSIQIWVRAISNMYRAYAGALDGFFLTNTSRWWHLPVWHCLPPPHPAGCSGRSGKHDNFLRAA